MGMKEKKTSLLLRCTGGEAALIRLAAGQSRRSVNGYILHTVLSRIDLQYRMEKKVSTLNRRHPAKKPLPLNRLSPGSKVPTSGVYRVFHHKHRAPHDVILIQSETFPACSKCAAAVRFQLLKAASLPGSLSGMR
jgi:hypothetical protein